MIQHLGVLAFCLVAGLLYAALLDAVVRHSRVGIAGCFSALLNLALLVGVTRSGVVPESKLDAVALGFIVFSVLFAGTMVGLSAAFSRRSEFLRNLIVCVAFTALTYLIFLLA